MEDFEIMHNSNSIPFHIDLIDTGYILRYERDNVDDCYDMELGAIIAVADLVDCIPIDSHLTNVLSVQELSLGDYSSGRYAWKLENVKKIDNPIRYKGNQGLWNTGIENII